MKNQHSFITIRALPWILFFSCRIPGRRFVDAWWRALVRSVGGILLQSKSIIYYYFMILYCLLDKSFVKNSRTRRTFVCNVCNEIIFRAIVHWPRAFVIQVAYGNTCLLRWFHPNLTYAYIYRHRNAHTQCLHIYLEYILLVAASACDVFLRYYFHVHFFNYYYDYSLFFLIRERTLRAQSRETAAGTVARTGNSTLPFLPHLWQKNRKTDRLTCVGRK